MAQQRCTTQDRNNDLTAQSASQAQRAENLAANDTFIQNAIWFIFVSTSTVGYGDIIAMTHAGRIVASLSMVAGIFCSALLTAALSKALELDFEELNAVNLCEREIAKRDLAVKAARLLQV